MKKLSALALSAFILLGATACGPTENYAAVKEEAEAACWDKHWPTYEKNIAAGMLTAEDARGKAFRMCEDVAQKAVDEAKATGK